MKALALLSLSFFLSLTAYAEDSTQCSGKYNKKQEKHGVWVCKKGDRLVKRERYKNGVLQTYIIFDEKGEIIETRDKKGRVRKFNPCGC